MNYPRPMYCYGVIYGTMPSVRRSTIINGALGGYLPKPRGPQSHFLLRWTTSPYNRGLLAPAAAATDQPVYFYRGFTVKSLPTAPAESPSMPATLRLRKFCYRALHVWFLFLEYRAGKWLPQMKGSKIDLNSRRIFRERNKARQEELGALFRRYQNFCHQCQACCGHTDLPLLQIDGCIYGFMPHSAVMIAPFKLRDLAKPPNEFLKVPQNHPGCWMLTPDGCKYAYGRRPTF